MGTFSTKCRGGKSPNRLKFIQCVKYTCSGHYMLQNVTVRSLCTVPRGSEGCIGTAKAMFILEHH